MADYTLQLPGADIDARLAKVPQLESALAGKQDTLVGSGAGQNIKTINNQSIVGTGNLEVGHEPDEEDISTDENGLLKFANRDSDTNSLGYVILREDDTFAGQVTEANTIYEIRYGFDLSNSNVSLPQNIVLYFNGGKLSNGTLTGNATVIAAEDKEIFSSITISGTWNVSRILSVWFSKDKYTVGNLLSMNNASISTEIYIDGDYDVYVPAAASSDGTDGIYIYGNTTVHISGTVRKDGSSVSPSTALFTINGDNVCIIGGTVDGNKSAFSTSDEYGHGFDIRGSKNVLFQNIKIQNCRGDGIYIGMQTVNRNITIRNCEIADCRRNGISVIFAQNILVSETYIHGINGTDPGAAIDVEPNSATQLCKNIVMRNCIIENCKRGISLSGTNAQIENSIFENVLVSFTEYTQLISLTNTKRTSFINCSFNTTGVRATTYAISGTNYGDVYFRNCHFKETGTQSATSYYCSVRGNFDSCVFDVVSYDFMNTLAGKFYYCTITCSQNFCEYSSSGEALLYKCKITAAGVSSISISGRSAAAPTRHIRFIDCELTLSPTYYPINCQYANDIEIRDCRIVVSGSRNLLSFMNATNVKANGNIITVGSNNNAFGFTSCTNCQAKENTFVVADGVTWTSSKYTGINGKNSISNIPGDPFYYEAEHKMLMYNGTNVVNLDGSALS